MYSAQKVDSVGYIVHCHLGLTFLMIWNIYSEYLKAHLLAGAEGQYSKLISLHTSENGVSRPYYGSEAN